MIALKDDYDIGLKGAWMQTFTGKQFFPLSPRVEDIDIIDIAHALSFQCRYGGHCKRFYSVAEHSIHIAHRLPYPLGLWGLLHDASEAYVSDVIRPIKPYLTNYTEIEDRLMAKIVERFGLNPTTMPPAVKDLDNRILMDERAKILAPPPAPWNFEVEPLGVEIKCWSPEYAEERFLDLFHVLGGV